jgi:hypothetical protein
MDKDEKSVCRSEIEVEKKTFEFELRENARGRFVRVTETRGHRSNMICVPEAGLAAFTEALHGVAGK